MLIQLLKFLQAYIGCRRLSVKLEILKVHFRYMWSSTYLSLFEWSYCPIKITSYCRASRLRQKMVWFGWIWGYISHWTRQHCITVRPCSFSNQSNLSRKQRGSHTYSVGSINKYSTGLQVSNDAVFLFFTFCENDIYIKCSVFQQVEVGFITWFKRLSV